MRTLFVIFLLMPCLCFADGAFVEPSTIQGQFPVWDIISNSYRIGSTSNYVEIEADGTIELKGDATAWKYDSVSSLAMSVPAGVTGPDIINWNSSSIKVHAFDGGTSMEELHEQTMLMPDYLEGSDITFHGHWSATDAGTGNVKWFIDYVVVSDTGDIATGTAESVVDATTGTAWESNGFDVATVTGTGFSIGDQVLFRIYREPTDAQDTYASDAVLLVFGIRYQCDGFGSRTRTSK